MESQWRGPQDVGLSLRTLSCLWTGGESFCRRPRTEAWIIPCGKLLRFSGCLEDEDVDSLRRPSTIVTVSEASSSGKAPASFDGNVVQFTVDSSPTHFDVTDGSLRGCLQRFLNLLTGLPCPVLIHSNLGCETIVDFLLIAVLKVLGTPDDVILAAADLLWPSIPEHETEHMLVGFRDNGGPESFFAEAVDSAAFRSTFACSLACNHMREWRGKEATWLKEDIKLMFKNARHAEEIHDDNSSASRKTIFWYSQVAIAGEQLADISSSSEAAAALFFRGSALARLAGMTSHNSTAEARYALELGAILASGDKAKKVMQQLTIELASVPRLVDTCVVEAKDAVNAVDATQRVIVVDLGEGTMPRDSDASDGGRLRSWQALPAPKRFAWIIFEPPGTLLAVSCTPEILERDSLAALGLVRSVQADASKGKTLVAVNDVVSEVASAMRSGAGCLLHCKAGTLISGTALACFLCKYGLGSVEEWNDDEPVALAVSEACELARGLRGNDAVDEAQVQFFEQSCWSEHVMSKLAQKQLASADDVALLVPSSTFRVVPQPADGNCMFHSLAHGLNRENASNLRKKICAYMKENPGLDISGTPLEEWVKMSAQTSVHAYAGKMSRNGEWGGGPEMAVCATMTGMTINVYESSASGFRLIACFNSGASSAIDILYVGRMHYEALERL